MGVWYSSPLYDALEHRHTYIGSSDALFSSSDEADEFESDSMLNTVKACMHFCGFSNFKRCNIMHILGVTA